jgi:transcriptional regulator with XRE-family HTH domain
MSNGGFVSRIKYLFSKGEGQGFRVLAKDKTAGVDVDKFFKRDQKNEAIKFAKEVNKKVEEAKKGFLTRSELAKKLGIKPATIEKYKIKNAEAYKKIKELFEIKKAGVTSPELYKPKTKTAVSEVKKVVDVGSKKPALTYKGEKTVIQKVKDILNSSDKALTEPEVAAKIKEAPKATVSTALSVLKKDKNFKNKIALVSPEEVSKIGAQTKATKLAPMMNTIRDQFVLDPDSDLEDIAKAIYGDKKFNAANLITKEKYLRDASNQIPKFVAQFSPGAIKTTPGFKDISPNKLGDILENIEIRSNDFGFQPGVLQKLRFTIADAKRGLAERTTEKARAKLFSPGKAVDEVAGTAATFERAPGYIEATQIIDSDVNQTKGRRLDPEFSRAFNKALAGDFSEVNSYNKKAKEFAKKYKIDVPIIKTGKNLKPEKIISNFNEFSPGAQKNIKDIAKEKGVVVQTKSKPLFSVAKGSGPTLGINLGLLKGLGTAAEVAGTPAAAALFAANTIRRNIREGQSLADAVVDPMVGADLLLPTAVSRFAPGVMKGVLGLGKVGRAFTPIGAALAIAGQGQEFYNQYKALQELKEQNPRAYEEFMATRVTDPLTAEELADIEDMGREGAMYGGRVGFAKGPKDPSRRKFIKIMGGLASLPLVGKYFKLAGPLSKAAPVATESVKLGFDKFMVLVNKIKSLGDDVTPQRSTIEREKVTVYQGKDGSEYELIEDLNTGNKRVTKDKLGVGTYGDRSYDTIDNRTVMEYTKGETIPGKKKGTKVADQYDEYEEVAGVDGTFDDVDDVRETVVKEIEDELK